MELGQLPAEGGLPVPQDLQEVREGGPQAVGGLVEDHGALLPDQGREALPALLPPHGEEALKGEAPRSKPADRQGGDQGTAPRDGLHGHALRRAELHQGLAGIADGGGPGVGDQGAGLPGQEPGENGRARRGLIVLVVAHQGLFDAEVVEELQGHPGVLGGDEVRPGQGLHRPGTEVPQVADGGGD